MDKSEKFSNISSGVQSLVVAAAVLIGGIWSAYTFNALKQIEVARTELQKLEKR